MHFYPAIDVRGGRVVQLQQGDYDRETVYGDDPATVARRFADAGAPWVHVVDLDAARRVVIGSAAVERPALVDELAELHSGEVAVGLDARGRDVATHGWRVST